MRRRGFTLIEVSVCALVGAVVLGSLTYAYVGGRQVQAASGRALDMLEGATVVMHLLRTDLRQLAFVPGKPVDGYSLRIAADRRGVRLRRSAPTLPGMRAGSAFVLVDYRLVPAKAPGRFHVARREWTASGAPLPGRTASGEQSVTHSAYLKDMLVKLREDERADARVLHVEMDVTSPEGALGVTGPTGAPAMVFSTVVQIQRPELAFGGNLPLFAEPLPAAAAQLAELPPGEVLAPVAVDASPLPPF